MDKSRSIGVALAFFCLVPLGVMPTGSNARPAGSDGLAFAIGLTFWQLVAALPLFAILWVVVITASMYGLLLAGPRRDRAAS